MTGLGGLHGRALVLLPSQGLGGGIEQYYRGLLGLGPFESEVVEVVQMRAGDRDHGRIMRQVRFAKRAAKAARSGRYDAVVCFHPGLLPVGTLCARLAGGVPLSAFYYGVEIWCVGRVKRRIRRHLAHVPVTISAFSAGGLATDLRRKVLIVMPPLRSDFATAAAEVARSRQRATDGLRVISVFRYAETATKGGYRLVEAAQRLRAAGENVSVSLIGHGSAPRELQQLAAQYDWLSVHEEVSEERLLELYASSDLFALGTELTFDWHAPSGEGFGIVLVEAALCGLPCVAPALGGGHDAIVGGWSGRHLRDDSVDALVDALAWYLEDRSRLALHGDRGRAWATEVFGPGGQAEMRDLVAGILHGRVPS